MTNPVSYAQGKFVRMDSASVSISDLGVQRGYAIFDFLRVSRNIPLHLEDHLDRFFHSAAEMHLSCPEPREQIKHIIVQLVSENELPDSGIRVILTGGESSDGYQISKPGLFIIQQAIQAPADALTLPGIRLLSYPFQRQLPQVKTTDYLMAIWLQPWLKKCGGDDILYHHDGIVTECPRSNFFMVTQSNVLVTPGSKMLKGVTRKKIVELANQAGLATEERDISLDEIISAKEAFITSSTKRIVPVRQLDDIPLPEIEKNSVTGQLWTMLYELEQRLTSLK